MATSKVTLKLLINKMECKVLLAEADKDFVDFLFYNFPLPVGSIVKLLKNKTMMGCLGDVYQSTETLSETYMLSNQNKTSVLNPKSPICPAEIPLLLSAYDEPKALKFYTCGLYVADDSYRSCPSCKESMDSEMTFVYPAGASTATAAEKEFVQGAVSYMVMDNLELKAISTISCINFQGNKRINQRRRVAIL